MKKNLSFFNIKTLAGRTFRHAVESPILYVVAIFYYGFVCGIFGFNYLDSNQASISGIGALAPWAMWIVIPALTMGLISDELRSGTFESMATLPIRDWEIVLGKYFGVALLLIPLTIGFSIHGFIAKITTNHMSGLDWGGTLGMLLGLYFVGLSFAAMGLFASSLSKSQVVSLIVGILFTSCFFFIGQFYTLLPGVEGRFADFIGVLSHLNTLGRGVFDLRDFVYFGTLIYFFLYLTVQRLTTRRF
ncbi:MAG: ABC transporter permease [Elusimicrobiota bacterium]